MRHPIWVRPSALLGIVAFFIFVYFLTKVLDASSGDCSPSIPLYGYIQVLGLFILGISIILGFTEAITKTPS